MITPQCALLVIDVQRGLDDPKYGRRSTPEAEANIARLLAAWREAQSPIIHIQHLSTSEFSPLRADSPGVEIKPEPAPLDSEPLFRKCVNNAFIGTGLERFLRQREIHFLVIVGLTTDHCVSTTARMAGDLGFETFVVADAAAAFELKGHDGRQFSAEDVHAVSLVALKDESAKILPTANVLSMFSA
jgi:nicotinamidase-related amidase